MLEKYRNWKKKPITWGDYVKMCKWSFALTGVVIVGELIYFYHDEIADKVKSVFDREDESEYFDDEKNEM